MFDKRASARHFGFGRADLSSPTLVRHEPSSLPANLRPRNPARACRFAPTQVPMVPPSGFPLLGRAGLSGQRAALIGRSQAPAAGTGASWSPPSPSLQEEHSAPPSEPRDQAGPEKTAGGRGSPAPANQERPPCSNGNDIKTETLEDA